MGEKVEERVELRRRKGRKERRGREKKGKEGGTTKTRDEGRRV